VPTESLVLEKVAEPTVSEAVPICEEPSKNVTEPAGVKAEDPPD
jgi:hypothetical protein